MTKKIIKLTKTETNELLKVITEEEPIYGLILKLQYIYGRNVSEVYNLTKNDIEMDKDLITFVMNGDKLTYTVHPEVRSLLYKTVEEAKKNYIFQEGERPLSNVKDGINYYLHKKTNNVNSLPFMEGLRLTTRDFKALRGQHLFEDGISIKTIHELYHNSNSEGTKKTICYDELRRMLSPSDVEEIIRDTHMDVYSDHSFNRNPIFYITNKDGEEAILEIKDTDISFYGDGELRSTFEELDTSVLLPLLGRVKYTGDYVYCGGLKFLRN